MKRLLLVTYAFPPAPSPGALRPGYLSRYLPQFGWEVTVLTASAGAPPFPARVISTATAAGTSFEDRLRQKVNARVDNPDSALRRFLRAAKETVLFPDTTAPWIPKALKAGSALLASEKFDAILSTAHPPSVHVVAWLLARRSGLPWIADYRDPWAGNLYLKRPPLRELLEECLERGMLARANAITTISEPIAGELRRFHRRREVAVIPNAYDPADWAGIPASVPARFDLCYTGNMYDGKRSPDVLFEALAQLRSENDPAGMNARVHFYGRGSEHVMNSAAAHNLSLIVRQHGTVPRAAAMRAQREAAVLLILLNMDPATSSEMGSKFLEYLGARRPIAAFGPAASVMRSFVQDHRLGWFACNVDEAKQVLRDAYRRFSAGQYEMVTESRDIPTAQSLAWRFAEILDRYAGGELNKIAAV